MEELTDLPSGSHVSQGNKAIIDFNINDSDKLSPWGIITNLKPRTKDIVESIQENYLEWAVTALIAIGSLPFVKRHINFLWKKLGKKDPLQMKTNQTIKTEFTIRKSNSILGDRDEETIRRFNGLSGISSTN